MTSQNETPGAMTTPGQGQAQGRDLVTFDIQFTKGGHPMATWTGFQSFGEAKRAIQDADLIIPLDWKYEIIPVSAPGTE